MIIQRLLTLMVSTGLVTIIAYILFDYAFAWRLIALSFVAGIVITWAVDVFWSRDARIQKPRQSH